MRITYVRGKGFKFEVSPAFLLAVATIVRLML